jgi:hypothetical protein
MRRITLLVAALAVAGALLAPTPALAGTASCPSGNFCAWEHINYDGMRTNWSGDDRYWGNNPDINNRDSSWYNAGISGPGIPDHVKVYDGFYLGGGTTICVRPGYSNRVGYSAGANDRGSSHTWTFGC